MRNLCICTWVGANDSFFQQDLPLGEDIFVPVKVFWLRCSFAGSSLVLSVVLASTAIFIQCVFCIYFCVNVRSQREEASFHRRKVSWWGLRQSIWSFRLHESYRRCPTLRVSVANLLIQSPPLSLTSSVFSTPSVFCLGTPLSFVTPSFSLFPSFSCELIYTVKLLTTEQLVSLVTRRLAPKIYSLKHLWCLPLHAGARPRFTPPSSVRALGFTHTHWSSTAGY